MASRRSAIATEQPRANNGLVAIAPGVFVHTGRHATFTPDNAGDVSNATVVVGERAIAVIDTGGSHTAGKALRAAISAVSPLPVAYVINTHMHPDHVLGNAAFRSSDTVFVAHHKMARALAARAERYLEAARASLGEAAFAGTAIVLPSQHVTSPTSIDLGGRILRLEPQPTAHTDNDLVVVDETTGTIIFGDLVFDGHTPALDGSILGWQTVLASWSERPAARIVPGHGPASLAWPAGGTATRRYLAAVTHDVRAMIARGTTLAEAMSTAAQGERDHWELFDDFHARNVAAAYAELEWE
ncbi:MAG: quinoprotein relay system zinc metallohydrolase 2 [Hyphomicrobiaceae bacterium]|nr:quinoprotein relay system zinc metallohydrolase 2 [Hyphomicrobiaceae bacterium]